MVAIDDFSDSLDKETNLPRGSWTNFDLCKEALSYTDAQCSHLEMSVYDVSPKELGTFDTVLFFGTLYHLRYPPLALDYLSSVCKRWIFVESAVLDDHSPYRGGVGKGYLEGNQLLMEFYPDNQYGDNPTNWWAPTLKCLIHMVRAAGFKDVSG